MPHLQISKESFWIIIAFLVAIEILLLKFCFVCGKIKGFNEGWYAQKDWKISNALRDETVSND